jgi:hypothetical protein
MDRTLTLTIPCGLSFQSSLEKMIRICRAEDGEVFQVRSLDAYSVSALTERADNCKN